MNMPSDKKSQIIALLKSIETGDPEAVAVVNEEKYIQHNPLTTEGSVGLAELFKRLASTSPRVTISRAFEDGEFVFLHTEYDFSSEKICFEVFRFEDGFAVEHWDNLQPKQAPNPSGHTMVDGPTDAINPQQTEDNRKRVHDFVEDVLVNRQLDKMENYLSRENFIQHNPGIADGLSALRSALQLSTNGQANIQYQQLHRVLADGNFVLTMCEGNLCGIHCAFYDLFRVENGKLVEHWDTIESIPPRSEWKNDNGKF